MLTLCMVGLAIGALGAGEWSIDNAIDLDWTGWTGLAVTAIAGGGGALLLLLVFWRPSEPEPAA